MRTSVISKNFLYYFLLICIALLSVHFRTGAASGDFNAIALSLRAMLWFGVFFVLMMLLNPRLFIVRPSFVAFNRTVVFYSWPGFIFLTLLSTVASALLFDVGVTGHDSMQGLQVIGCFAILLVVYNLLIRDPYLVKGILVVLLCLPAVQILGVVFVSPEFAEVLGVNSDYDVIWYFGYGNRFVGLLGNANAVAHACCIALPILSNILLSRHDHSKLLWGFAKVILAIYGCAILAMVFLTGVRAAMLSVLIMFVGFSF